MKHTNLYTLTGLIIASSCLMEWSAHATTQDKVHKPGGVVQKKIKAARIFSDCPGCPKMVVIPGGNFIMGSPVAEIGRREDGDPVHRVTIASFALGKTEITRGQFSEFVKATGYRAGNKCWTIDDGKYEDRSGNWGRVGYMQDNSHPVVCINWNDARAYTKWLSLKTGKMYRLPSEAEWEYAARGNTTGARYWGDSPATACTYANTADLTAKELIRASAAWKVHNCKDGFAYTAPVGSFQANAYGLNDMLGNVWEWVEDSYHKNYQGAPADGSAWLNEDKNHVLRGGSWYDAPRYVRSAGRDKAAATRRYDNIGFRVARMLP